MTRCWPAARLLAGMGWEIGPAVFLTYLGLSTVGLVAPLLLAVGLRPLVDGIAGGSARSVATGAVLCGVALLLTVSAPIAYRWATVRMRERSIMVIQRRLLILATTAPGIGHFERPDFRDRLALLRDSSGDLVTGMSVVFAGPLVVAQLATAGVLLARLVPVLLLVPLVAVPATLLSRTGERIRRSAELRSAEAARTAQDLFMLAVSAPAAPDIRLYGLRGELLERHRAASRAARRIRERAIVRSVGVEAAGWLLFGAAYLGGALLVLHAGTPGDVALTLGLATAMVAGAGRLTELGGSVLRVLTASAHYHWLAAEAAVPPGVSGPPPGPLRDGIVLDRVSFRYAGGGRDALTDVSLRLPAGAVVAIVGENGAGKTTLVKLLCGLYRPSSGQIRIDGADLATMDLAALRARCAAGFQDFMRYEFVLREAVGVGDLPRMADADAVRRALGKVGADFVDGLPDGLETQLGTAWPAGVDLSGGEWQKVALARALLRERPLLTVLDEPTAALDPPTEHRLFEQVAADAPDGGLTLIISHRFSTVRMADLIVVLDGGRVVESGTHDQLIANRGRYAELYHLQAEAYR